MQIYIYTKCQLPGRSYVYKVQIYTWMSIPKRAWNCGVSEACRTAVTWKEDCQTESVIICIKIIIINTKLKCYMGKCKNGDLSKYVQMLSLTLSFYFKYNKLNICNIFESWRPFATFGISPENHFRLPRDFHWRINDTTYETSCFLF